MNPKVKEKLSWMANEKWIDISVIMAGKKPPIEPTPIEDTLLNTTLSEEIWMSEVPEVSAEWVYELIREQFIPLDSDEVLKVIHLILMNRTEDTED